MTETRETTTSKEMETTMYASLQDEIKSMKVKFQSQLNPLQEVLNEVAKHIRGKKSLGKNYEPHGEETSTAAKDPLSFGLFTSPPHTMGDTRHRIRGPKLDMQKFDGTDPEGWISQMEHFFFLHNICTTDDKYQVALLYLDAKCWQWRQWHKHYIVGHIDWSIFSKALCSHFDWQHTFWEG